MDTLCNTLLPLRALVVNACLFDSNQVTRDKISVYYDTRQQQQAGIYILNFSVIFVLAFIHYDRRQEWWQQWAKLIAVADK